MCFLYLCPITLDYGIDCFIIEPGYIQGKRDITIKFRMNIKEVMDKSIFAVFPHSGGKINWVIVGKRVFVFFRLQWIGLSPWSHWNNIFQHWDLPNVLYHWAQKFPCSHQSVAFRILQLICVANLELVYTVYISDQKSYLRASCYTSERKRVLALVASSNGTAGCPPGR